MEKLKKSLDGIFALIPILLEKDDVSFDEKETEEEKIIEFFFKNEAKYSLELKRHKIDAFELTLRVSYPPYGLSDFDNVVRLTYLPALGEENDYDMKFMSEPSLKNNFHGKFQIYVAAIICDIHREICNWHEFATTHQSIQV